jgi:hypothetical protein
MRATVSLIDENRPSAIETRRFPHPDQSQPRQTPGSPFACRHERPAWQGNMSLPFGSLDRLKLQQRLDEIGQTTLAITP